MIRERYSCRAYLRRRIDPSILAEMKKACAVLRKGLSGEAVRFRIVEISEAEQQRLDPVDFSLIINPITFIAAVIRRAPTAYESCGYLMEHLVLKAADLGLATCWLGYFNASFFEGLHLAGSEILPAVCVVGFAAEPPDISPRERREYMFFTGNFATPLSARGAGEYNEALEMVRLAPSAGNTQPWRIVREAERDVFHFFKESIDRQYEKKRLHHIDIGIAMCHFELAAGKKGLEGHWRRLEPGPLVGTVPPRTEYIMSWIEKP